MPMYCFTTKDGETVERHFPMAHIPKRVKVEGRWATRNMPAEWRNRRDPGDGWPLHSDAMGVHVDQIPEAEAKSRTAGIPTHFDKYGRPILTCRSHRKRYMRLRGFLDRDGGYGD